MARRDACPNKEYNMNTIIKAAAVFCAVAILGQVGRCDMGTIGLLECIAQIALWGVALAACFVLTVWQHVR